MIGQARRRLSTSSAAVLVSLGVALLAAGVAQGREVCPAGMSFVPGGDTVLVYSGERWGGTVEEPAWVDDFCIDTYEASQPDATDVDRGSWVSGSPVPAAQSVAGVLSWIGVSYNEAREACAAAGKRLPTLAEWQTAYSGYAGAYWPWGTDEYDPTQVDTCWINQDPPPPAQPTGGCCFENCLDDQCFTTCDMLGNIGEVVDDLWDEDCYGNTQISFAGAGMEDWSVPNGQLEDPDQPGCWLFYIFAQTRYGLHHHGPDDSYLLDDGFRCAMSLDDDTTDDDTTDDDTTDDDTDDDITDDDSVDDDSADDDAIGDDDGSDDDMDSDDVDDDDDGGASITGGQKDEQTGCGC